MSKWSILLPVTLAACSGAQGPPRSSFELAVAPLALVGIDYACYDLRVTGPTGTVVTLGDPERAYTEGDDDTVCSWQYGNRGGGDIGYVAPCDADDGDGDGRATNSVTLWVDGLYRDADGDHDAAEDDRLDDWQDPCAAGCTLDVPCSENRDTAVEFNLTVVRDAKQGFFDIGVNFADIFCSAKLDCHDALLHNPSTGERDTTAVIAFACTAGEGDTTTLYMNDIRVECAGSGETHYVNPALGPGQHGAVGPLFQTATYVGNEQLPGLDKCFWNNSLGIDPAVLGADCTVHVRATAGTFDGNHTPANTRYPVITFDVPLTNGAGALVCDDAPHPLNGGNGVATEYGELSGERFSYAMPCGTTTPVGTERTSCVVPNYPAGLTLRQTADGIDGQVGNGPVSATFDLAPGLSIQGCCANGCCL